MEVSHSTSSPLKIAFIHGRPQGHPIHALYANALQADFFYEDRLLPWHGIEGASKLRRYLSWMLNAFFFPNKGKYAVYLTECVRIPQFLMKTIRLMSRHQKLVILLADESLYFVDSRRYPRRTVRLIVSCLEKADALICIGTFQTGLAKKILGNAHHSKIHTIFNGVPRKIYHRLLETRHQSRTKTVLFVGHAQVNWRIWYKGVDLMIEAFAKAYRKDNELRFILVGDINIGLLKSSLGACDAEARKAIVFAGKQLDILEFINRGTLYLHCSRGDAFPTVVLEAMAGGLVPLISTVTGTSEVVSEVDSRLIVPLDSSTIAERIGWFFGLDNDIKIQLSEKCRRVISQYTESKALFHFCRTFNDIVNPVKKQPN